MTANQFADEDQQREAWRLGVWAFLASETLVFAGLFTLYAAYRSGHTAAFVEASRRLYQSIGLINTCVLLLSSFAMARAMRWAHAERGQRAFWLLAAAGGLGVAFVVLKVTEYVLDAREGILPGVHFDASMFDRPDGARLFLTLYFVITVLHALHLLAGIAVVGVSAIALRRGRLALGDLSPLEPVALYWHFVDAVWVLILPLLYLVT